MQSLLSFDLCRKTKEQCDMPFRKEIMSVLAVGSLLEDFFFSFFKTSDDLINDTGL